MIEASRISHFYEVGGQPLQVLHELDLHINAGEMVAIQGPSGSGKSTLMYLLGCLQKVQSGKLMVNGADVSHLDEAALARFRNSSLGFVFQQFHLLPRTTVIDNILLPASYPTETANPGPRERVRAEELARAVGLGDRLHHTPSQLSGGQQQRVAIARALMNDPPLLLADEPTGNLDSASSAQILDLLRGLQKEGRTVLVITHDAEVAARCDRVIHVRDGRVVDSGAPPAKESASPPKAASPSRRLAMGSTWRLMRRQLPLAWESLNRNRARSFLTMFGITIGIASVLSMVTLGQFTKWKILDSYADLGVNTLSFYGYPNWNLKATDAVSTPFRAFDWDRDITPLYRIFPQVERMSPNMMGWRPKITFSGKEFPGQDTSVIGVNEFGLSTMNRTLVLGQNFGAYHVENASPVCLVGLEIAQQLLANTLPIGQILNVEMDNKKFACRVMGVLKHASSKSEWMKPDSQIIIPYSLMQAMADNIWARSYRRIAIQLRPGSDVEKVGKGIRAFFEQKYGKAGMFRVDNDSVLISQMKKFLTLFSVLLTLIALVSLAVGGVGITNMMLVSVNERFREIGLRKALGATPASVRVQFLTEAVVICAIGGLLGMLVGFGAYHLAIYGATQLVPKLQFEWTIDWYALLLSVLSIALVGVLSGLFPALKAERLQVIEAMRSE
ncbi:MAG: ATP-binding cassette domain-containing protein [Bdellovibrionota bacterium]